MEHEKPKDLEHLQKYTAEEIYKMGWYERMIEPEIRPIVKLLRDNGFNTTGSCGHEMFVVVSLQHNLYEIGEILNCLCDNGFKHFDIKVDVIQATQFFGLAKISFKYYNDVKLLADIS